MDETYEDKSRVRKDLDVEDENILALQTNITELTAGIKKEISDKFFDDDINDEDTQEDLLKPLPIQVSVQMNVEKCGDIVNQNVHADNDINIASSTHLEKESVTHLEKHSVNNKEIVSEDEDENCGFDKTYFIRTILPHSKKNTNVPIKEYTITKKTILKAMEVQSKENTTQVDKHLDIEMRNFHGEFKEAEKSLHDELIYKALEKWKDWYEICPSFRNSPLLYICYICNIGWWRLYIFREHIKNHKERYLKLTTESSVHEYYLAAYTTRSSLSIKNVEIDSNCWKCGKSAKFHSLTTETYKYQCEGCKATFMQCTELTQHEGMCKEYMEMRCRKLKLNTFECITCSLCFRNFINQTELDVHMTECHLVRSDEPIFMQAKRCSYCHRSFYVFAYHDCPKRIKNVKCKNCCRKFTTRGFKNLHMHVNDGIVNCFLCKTSMKACSVMEHIIEHSKNYRLLYQCASCKDNVLYTTETNFKNHTRLHERLVDRRRWSTRILIPSKCVNGEIVKSKAVITIPVIDHRVMSVLPKIPEKPSVIDNTKQSNTNDDELVIVIKTDCPPLTEIEEQVKCDDYEQQVCLDAEKEKDVEMEIPISKGLGESNILQKLLEKETKFPMKDFYEGNIILERRDIIPVTSNSHDEAGIKTEMERPVENNVEDNIAFKKVEELNLHSEIIIKDEPDWNNITDEEPYLVEINEESDQSCEEYDKSTKLLQLNAGNNENTVSLGQESYPHNRGIKNMSASKNKIYNCDKCLYKGNQYYRYVDHVTTNCGTMSFFCSACSLSFSKLELYALHLTKHDYKKLTCPDCQQEFKHLYLMCRHIKKHLRLLLEKVPKYNVPGVTVRGSMTDMFQCKKCNSKVTLEKLFSHWEAHLKLKKKESPVTERPVGSKESKKTTDAKLVATAVDVLLAKETRDIKQCIICQKQFLKRNACKRHLIHHLLAEALKITEETGDQLRCQICNLDLSKIEKFKQHMRQHASLPFYKCDLCSKEFIDSSNFSKHRKLHNIFSYICDLCGRMFNAKANLITHLKMHEDNTARCEECHKTFNTLVQLRKHRTSHITQLRTYPCKVCRKRFCSSKEVWDHLWLVHKQRKIKADCHICSNAYRTMADVKRHMKNVHCVELKNITIL